MYFYDTFHAEYQITTVQAGLLGGCFAVMNLIARPGGGWFSDKYGRKLSLTLVVLGLTIGFAVMSQITSAWPLWLAVLVVIVCSLFVQAGCGAVFAMAPLIKRRMTGQIAGMVGAYGNVGGVVFLTVLSFVTPSTFFLTIAGVGVFVLVAVRFIDEPKGHMAEVQEDGSVEMIEIG